MSPLAPRAGSVLGGGVIAANGGNGGGGGGGGRIALYYQDNSFSGALAASGGAGGGGAGTIYTKSGTQTYGDLLVDNGGHTGAATALVDAAYTFDHVEVMHGGNLEIPAGTVVAVNQTELAVHDGGQLTILGALVPTDGSASQASRPNPISSICRHPGSTN